MALAITSLLVAAAIAVIAALATDFFVPPPACP